MCELKDNSKFFLYFAYGSNLLAKRLCHSSPSAEFLDYGVLQNYRLDFAGHSERWGGAPATIVPTENSAVWGAIWKISDKHSQSLDQQEDVHNGIYSSFEVGVLNEIGHVYRCRVYRQTREIVDPTPLSDLPEDRRPSLVYLNTIIRGAQDCGLPLHYIEDLTCIRHNHEESFTPGTDEIGLTANDIKPIF